MSDEGYYNKKTTTDTRYLVEWYTEGRPWLLDDVFTNYEAAVAYAKHSKDYTEAVGDTTYTFRIIEEIVEHSVSRSELERY